jgi:DNA transposition AAA+ family ATPase
MLLGSHGAGKSRLLEEIKKDYPRATILSGLGTVAQVIGSMAGETDVRIHKKQEYIKSLLTNPGIIFVDEAQHLRPEIFPYIKLFIDKGNIFIMAGLPSLAEKMIDTKNADVLSRFLRIKVHQLSVSELMPVLRDFDEQAIKLIHGQAESTRVLIETIEDCRLFAQENSLKTITEDIAEKIFNGEL